MIDQDTLIAYAEGELQAEEAVRVAVAVAGDSALREQVVRQRAISSTLRAAYQSVLEEPIPPHLLQLVDALSAEPADKTPR